MCVYVYAYIHIIDIRADRTRATNLIGEVARFEDIQQHWLVVPHIFYHTRLGRAGGAGGERVGEKTARAGRSQRPRAEGRDEGKRR